MTASDMRDFKDIAKRKLRARSEFDGNGCRVWTRGKDYDGYGAVRIDGTQYRAHRLAYEVAYGPIPEGLVVMHTCDNPSCIHFQHLRLGTVADNNRDRARKGRSATGDDNGARLYPGRVRRGLRRYFRENPEARQGENNGRAKLTADDVRVIRARYANENIRQADLAKEYDVTQVQISSIVRGESWPHVGLDLYDG